MIVQFVGEFLCMSVFDWDHRWGEAVVGLGPQMQPHIVSGIVDMRRDLLAIDEVDVQYEGCSILEEC